MTEAQPATRMERRRWRARKRYRRYGLGGAALAVALVAALVGLGTWDQDASVPRTRTPQRTSGIASPAHTAAPGPAPTAAPTVASPAVFAGADGVRSAAVMAENDKPGTTAWKITDAPQTGMIEGFADQNYVADGNVVGLYVSTSASSFRVVAYRMGYYQGTGGRQIWSSDELPGTLQPDCPVTPATNMVSCDNWSRSLVVPISASWPPGDYLLKLIGSGNEQAYVLLTVWDPSSHATYLIVNRTLTEEGWNSFGGYDYYQGEGPCIIDYYSYPACNRARVVSLDRPYSGDGSSDFLGNEYPLIYWMEEQGLDVTYATDITLTQDPGFALQHRAWLSLDHDETWTSEELNAANVAKDQGVNLLFFSGAAIVRHSRLQASPLGADRQEVDYRNAQEDPAVLDGNPDGVTANTWDSSHSALTGETYAGYLLPGVTAAPMVIFDASSWMFEGTGLQNGSSIPGVIGSDIDHIDPSSGLTPPDLQVVAHSPIPLNIAYTNQGKWSGSTYSDFTYYTDPVSKAGVIDTGDTTFITDLEPCPTGVTSCPGPILGRIVGNILRVFGQGPAGASQPSVGNWMTVSPSGS